MVDGGTARLTAGSSFTAIITQTYSNKPIISRRQQVNAEPGHPLDHFPRLPPVGRPIPTALSHLAIVLLQPDTKHTTRHLFKYSEMIRPDKRRYATVKKRLALDENTVRPTDRQLGNFKNEIFSRKNA